MPFHFCPQCGTKLQPSFRFCPSCGERLPDLVEEPGSVNSSTSSSVSSPKKDEPELTQAVRASSASCKITARPALQRTRNSLRLDRSITTSSSDASPPKMSNTRDGDHNVELDGTPSKQNIKLSSTPDAKSPRPARGKAKVSGPTPQQVEEEKRTPVKRKVEDLTVHGSPEGILSPASSPAAKALGGKGKAKKGKFAPALEALQEGEEVMDTTGNKWKLVKLVGSNMTELIYEVSRSNSKESNHILKLGAKVGKIFNEQNFLQRAAKPASVDKWIKQHKMDFLGIPSCVGFGLHADSYRFLVFPNMGESLQSIMKEEDECISEKAVLQLACRILDVLQYIHSNEYVHADINAENIYIKPGQKSQVYLVGYCHAFRYCPGERHVEYREASRTSHEGTVEFISLDAHKGAAPSRRGDLQSLGYCMLRWHTGMLPWSAVTNPGQVAAQKQRYIEDVSGLVNHCFGKKNVSRAFLSYLTTVMALQYTEQPDYCALKDGLSQALLQLGGSVEQPLSF